MPDEPLLSPPPPAELSRPPAVLRRLASIDTFRGLVLFLMVAEILLQLHAVGKALPESQLWQFLRHHQTHADWEGASLHDLIHPSFTFLVGVALPFSLAGRLARGESLRRLMRHAAWRSVLLVALGIFLRSVDKPRTYFIFMDTLTQIGLGYFPLFLIGLAVYQPGRGLAWRAALPWAVLVVILVGDWAAFALYPVSADGEQYFRGFAAHWNKHTNLGAAFDSWFLNLFPQYDGRPFVAHPGGYTTLNFIPHLGTMLLGLIAGGWLKSLFSRLGDHADGARNAENDHGKAGVIGVRLRQDAVDPRTSAEVLLRLVGVGVVCLALGLALDRLGICPIVKRLWTSSWVLFSGGWCFLILAGLYYLTDVRGYQAWTFPFVVLGVNSIAVYFMADLAAGFLLNTVQTHLGFALDVFGAAYTPLLRGLPALAIFWLFFYWLHRRGFYVKL